MEASWEKPKAVIKLKTPKRAKFAVAGTILIGAMVLLFLSGTASGSQFFITVNDLVSRPDLVGQTVKVSGAVIGSTIKFDPDTKTIYFTMAHVTDNSDELAKEGGLGQALAAAVADPTAKRVQVEVPNQAIPDLLKDQAQAIVTGKLNSDGVFVATELLLKCPSKYAAEVPAQASGS